MALKTKVIKAEFDTLNPVIQAEYKLQPDSSYLLDGIAVDGIAIENVTGLKTALSSERESVRLLKAKVDAIGDLDPTKAREALNKVEEMKTWKPDDQVRAQIEARETALTTKFTGELTAKDGVIKDLDGQLAGHLIDAAAISAIAKAKGKTGLLLPHVKGSIKLQKNAQGKYEAVVVDKNGNPRITNKSGSTDPMSIDEYVETLKSDSEYAVAFDGSGASGGGSGGNQGGGGGKRTIGWTDQQALNSNIEDIASGKVTVSER